MSKLGNPRNTMDIINKNKFVIQKKYGQNFLIDANILEKIVDAADITEDDFVIEIGPGIGALTQYLCESAKEVVAIEIDKKLIPILEDTLKDYSNVTVLNQDVLKTDIKALVENLNDGRPIKVVANLPYYITTPIIMDLFEKEVPLISVTVMVQKEVGERINAMPGTKEYGALSLAIQYYSVPELVTTVAPNCFIPKPNVDSIVVKMEKHKEFPVRADDERLLFKVIRASFNQRRKTLINGLYNAGVTNNSKDELGDLLESIDIKRNVRGEDLSLEEFAKLSNEINKNKSN